MSDEILRLIASSLEKPEEIDSTPVFYPGSEFNQHLELVLTRNTPYFMARRAKRRKAWEKRRNAVHLKPLP